MTISRQALHQRAKAWVARGQDPEAARVLASVGPPLAVLGAGANRSLKPSVAVRRAAAEAAGISDARVAFRMRQGKTLEEAIAMGRLHVGRPRKLDVTETWDPVVA